MYLGIRSKCSFDMSLITGTVVVPVLKSIFFFLNQRTYT